MGIAHVWPAHEAIEKFNPSCWSIERQGSSMKKLGRQSSISFVLTDDPVPNILRLPTKDLRLCIWMETEGLIPQEAILLKGIHAYR